MHYTVLIALDCYHKPSGQWHTYRVTHGLRAVSRKHALDKGLKHAITFPSYYDRARHPDWVAYAEVSIVEEGA